MRETKYARQLRQPGRVQWDDTEGQIERIPVNASLQEEIRFSWWKNGKLVPRPLDLSEDDLITLFRNAIANDVFTDRFRAELRELL
jgi:hypothetical protein